MNHPCNKEREIDLLHSRFDSLEEKLDKRDEKINQKLDSLISWKLKIIGGASVVIFVSSILFKTKLF